MSDEPKLTKDTTSGAFCFLLFAILRVIIAESVADELQFLRWSDKQNMLLRNSMAYINIYSTYEIRGRYLLLGNNEVNLSFLLSHVIYCGAYLTSNNKKENIRIIFFMLSEVPNQGNWKGRGNLFTIADVLTMAKGTELKCRL